MKKWSKFMLVLLLVCASLSPTIAQAATPYKTYTMDGYGYVTETQTAYTPYQTIEKIGADAFINPVDMCISKDGLLYVADAELKRIIVSDLEGEFIRYIGEGQLVQPTGVYVSAGNLVYVADKGGEKVAVFDAAGELLTTYGRPDSPIYGNSLNFKPMKIVANESGTLYII
ncbi:MAG: hypothetical protein K2N94_02265, partial [Lachnospiraceae bacterium]|nr:hypothetical protein [Lachnospiraceae bacterium]